MANSDEWGAPIEARPPRRWPRRLAKMFGVLAGVLVVLYFVVTSSFFLKAVVLPRAGSALNAQVSADSIALRPFSSVRIKDLKLQPANSTAPLLTVNEVSAKYSLLDIIRRRFNIETVTISSPVIDIVEQADGSSNLDALLKGGDTKTEAEAPTTSPAPQVHLNRFELQNATVRRTKILADGTQERLEVSGLNISVSNLRNGHSAALSIAAQLASGDALKAELGGEIECGLTAELKPERIQGRISVRTTAAEKDFAPLAGLAAELNCQLSPSDLEQFSLTLARTGKVLAKLSATGPLDLAHQQGRIKVNLTGVDRQLLNLFGSASGIDFAGTVLSSEHVVDLGEGAQKIAAQGNLKVSQLTLARNAASNKPIDLLIEYGAKMNRSERSATIDRLAISGTGVRGGLQQPVRIAFTDGPPNISDSQFALAVTNFNLADWGNFITNGAGEVNLFLDARAEQSGKKLHLDLRSTVTNLAAQVGSNRFDRLSIALGVKGEARDLTAIELGACDLQVIHNAAEVCTLTAAGTYNVKARAADLKADLTTSLPAVARLVDLPDVKIGSGTIKLKTRVLQDAKRISAQGDLQLLQLQASRGDLVLNNFETGLTWDAALETNVARLAKFDCAFRQGGLPAGSLSGTSHYSLSNGAAAANLIITDLNEKLVRPFVPPEQLPTITVGGTVVASHDPATESAVRADLRLGNLKGAVSLDVKMDAALQKSLAHVRDFSTTVRANGVGAGQLALRGSYDLTNQTAQGQISIKDMTQGALASLSTPIASILLNGDLTASYNPKGQSAVKGILVCSNLVMRDASQKPLSVALDMDGALSNQVLNLQTFKLKLDPTERAKNELTLWGVVNLARTDAIQGNLELSANSLDLAPYEKMFAGPVATNAQPASTNAAPAHRPDPGKPPVTPEPAPVKLPFQEFSFNAAIDRLFVQGLALEECLMKLRLNQSRVQLQPLKFAVNGAPANLEADVNLGVPGYKYDVTLLANKLPLEPLLAAQGKFRGALGANVKLRGAGITPPSLRSNLNGGLEIQLSDAHIQANSPYLRAFLTPIAFFLRAPELTNTPLSSAAVSAQIGAGRVQMRKFNLTSDAYMLDTQGDLVMQDVLQNSAFQRWPIYLQLSRALGQRLKLGSRNAPADAAYVKTPDFLRLAGTVGDPKVEINPAGIAGTVLEKVTDRLLPQTPQTPKLFP